RRDRLARSGLADDADHLPRAHAEADVVDDRGRTELGEELHGQATALEQRVVRLRLRFRRGRRGRVFGGAFHGREAETTLDCLLALRQPETQRVANAVAEG